MMYVWLRCPLLVPQRFTSWVPCGWLVLSRRSRGEVSERHRIHEEQHLRQQRAWAALSRVVWAGLLVWTWLNGRDVYYDHPWERQAREAGNAGRGVPVSRWAASAGAVFTALLLIYLTHLTGLDLFDTPGWAR
jgi:hypothetical protein